MACRRCDDPRCRRSRSQESHERHTRPWCRRAHNAVVRKGPDVSAVNMREVTNGSAHPTMRTILLFVTGAIAIYLITTLTTARPLDINNPFVQEVGNWAVMEHVKQAKDGIKFNKVVRADQNALGLGINYDLIIDASNNDGKDGKYEANVYLRDWADKRTLLAFQPAN
ncbi:hypothetical protein EJB05_11650, partial [Eragrostis curvula]